ncbi:HVCN1 [Symbiodinium sp. KB8]|nr:HVCN1 [Symbiodinium sp. KB8]
MAEAKHGRQGIAANPLEGSSTQDKTLKPIVAGAAREPRRGSQTMRDRQAAGVIEAATAFELSPKGHRAALIKGNPTVSKMTADDFNRYTDADIESQAITWGVKEGQRERSCRLKLANFLESHRVTLVNLFLIIIDVVAVACELMLANVCEVSTHGSGGHRRMSGTGDSVEGEVEHQNEVVHHIEAALHWTSVSILGVFLVQQFLLMYALGRGYCRKYALMVDFVVIVVALVLETAISSTAAGFLVAVLSWRAIRLLHGIFVSIESEHHTYHKALHKAEEIHEQLVQRSSYWFVMAQYYRLRAVGRRITRAVESSYRPQVFKERTQRARAMRQERPATPKVTPGKRKH